MVSPLPNSSQPLANVRGAAAFITVPWQRWLNQFTTGVAAPVSATVTASPFSFQAPIDGTVFVSGGTVSNISVIRSGTTIPTGVTAGPIPVSTGDSLRVTYSGLPTINFVPA